MPFWWPCSSDTTGSVSRLLCALAETIGASSDWEHVLDKTIDKVLLTRRAAPGNVALRRAMRSAPELAEIDQQANTFVAKWFAEQVRQLTGLSERRALVVARMAIEAETALMDWWESPDVDYAPMVAREIKALAQGVYRAVCAAGHPRGSLNGIVPQRHFT